MPESRKPAPSSSSLPEQAELRRRARRARRGRDGGRRAASARGPRGVRCTKPCWMQIGLDDVLDRVARLGQRRGDGLDADRPAAEIDRRSGRGSAGPSGRGRAHRRRAAAARCRRSRASRLGAVDDGEVAHPAQQTAGDARRAARRAWRSRSRRPSVIARPSTRAPRAHDQLQLLDGVEIRAGSGCRSGRAAAW